ncbi:MAG: hypothetical protein M3Y24_09290 [Acidobacteriota bacterium]|nr:hypothetical protein [Acidobacteriota bacterium]
MVECTAPDGEFVWQNIGDDGFVPANPHRYHSISDLLLSEDDEEPENCSPAAA